ncbi:unnamed protein product [Cuscuta europaea]|uniref:Uncharacterized protein n=1 Tax=Cuscuta europaea TaxID=41803 RepID=A0A9P0ZHM8_CUSEU|nr:unnamed protein product [Cuscuta europaea]
MSKEKDKGSTTPNGGLKIGRGRGQGFRSMLPHNSTIEYHEKDFSEDNCFLDILAMCHKLVDVYSVGIKIIDGDGRPLRCDLGVTNMLKQHAGRENIYIYLYRDDTRPPFSYKLLEHNREFGNDSLVPPSPIPMPNEVQPTSKSMSRENNKGSTSKRSKKKARGRNKCNEVLNLKKGEKLKVKFYNNRVVGKKL